MLTEAICLAPAGTNCSLLPQNAGPTVLLYLISLNLVLQYSKLPTSSPNSRQTPVKLFVKQPNDNLMTITDNK